MRAAALAALALVACSAEARKPSPKPLPPERAAEVLRERIWIDKLPRSQGEKFHVAVFEGRAGITQHRSIWKGNFELFVYELDGNEIDFTLPGSGNRMHSTFHIEPYAGGRDNADMKLVVDHPPTGPREYLGFAPEGGHADAASIDAWVAARFSSRK